jgi:hypothetical protein
LEDFKVSDFIDFEEKMAEVCRDPSSGDNSHWILISSSEYFFPHVI